jgi:hypothetical protein
MQQSIRIEMNRQLVLEAFDAEAAEALAFARVEAVAEDAAALLAKATPVGVMGVAQGAWLTEMKVSHDRAQGEIVAVSDPTPVAPYLYYVIHGTRPGSPHNPGKHLVEWVRVKLKKGREVAYMIGAHIQKHGRKGNDFVQKVTDENAEAWDAILQGAYTS